MTLNFKRVITIYVFSLIVKTALAVPQHLPLQNHLIYHRPMPMLRSPPMHTYLPQRHHSNQCSLPRKRVTTVDRRRPTGFYLDRTFLNPFLSDILHGKRKRCAKPSNPFSLLALNRSKLGLCYPWDLHSIQKSMLHGRHKRQSKENIMTKLSKLKAKEHMALEKRRTQMELTEETKRQFMMLLDDEFKAMSAARAAELKVEKAYRELRKLEKEVTNDDKALHRVKEQEDMLYEELLDSQVKDAKASLALIPLMQSEDSLQRLGAGING